MNREHHSTLNLLKHYKKEWLTKDIAAGLSVAAIALPIGIAYSGIAGLPPETGLYASILPVIAYAFFGSSRQLIIGPDSATCMLVAAALMRIAAEGSPEYVQNSPLLAIIVGIYCVIGGFLKLGRLANFLSKPVLTGYLNGIAISIALGQLAKLFGFKTTSSGFMKTIFEFVSKFGETNYYSLAIGVIGLFILVSIKHFMKKIPAPFILVVLGIAASMIMGLDEKGVAITGAVKGGLSVPVIPTVDFSLLPSLATDCIGIALITFCSMMLTNKSFAIKNGYRIDANKDFIALGISNIFSGLSGGFAVSGADSRTAVNNNAGGKTQLTSIISALTIGIIAAFFTQYIYYLPISVLSAIILVSAVGLFNITYLKKLYEISKKEFFIAVLTTLGVITIGVIPSILLVVGLSIFMLITGASRPHSAELAKDKQTGAFHNVDNLSDGETYPGILLYRFDSPLVFFNADFVSNKVMEAVNSRTSPPKYVLIDFAPVNYVDATAADTLISLANELSHSQTGLGFANIKAAVKHTINVSGIAERIGKENLFETMDVAIENIIRRNSG